MDRGFAEGPGLVVGFADVAAAVAVRWSERVSDVLGVGLLDMRRRTPNLCDAY